MSEHKDMVVFAINGLKSVRAELTQLSENVADMISVLLDVLAEAKDGER